MDPGLLHFLAAFLLPHLGLEIYNKPQLPNYQGPFGKESLRRSLMYLKYMNMPLDNGELAKALFLNFVWLSLFCLSCIPLISPK